MSRDYRRPLATLAAVIAFVTLAALPSSSGAGDKSPTTRLALTYPPTAAAVPTAPGTASPSAGASDVTNCPDAGHAADPARRSDAALPSARPRPAASQPRAPGDLLDTSNWYLTLPTGRPGKPDTVESPTLGTFISPAFRLSPDHTAVLFSAPAGGVTTKNSNYPRSELREMNGTKKAAWTNAAGAHTLEACEAVTQLPKVKPEVVAAQIHDARDDVLEIRLEGRRLTAQSHGGRDVAVLNPAYTLGTPYHLKLVAANNRVQVFYNGAQKADLALRGSGWYFKIGAYVQSNTQRGEMATTSGSVAVFSVVVRHSDSVAAAAAASTTSTHAPRMGRGTSSD